MLETGQDVHPVEIGGVTVKPGTLRRLELPVARLPMGTWLSLPVAVVHGQRPGPRIWIDAAIHGDELNGVPIIHELLRRLQPRSIAGTVFAVPVVNIFGLINRSRYLPDRRDLNRSFPGSRRGSLAAQIAHLFLGEVVERCELGIDLHTGSSGRTNLPQIRCNLDDAETRALAQVFGAPVMLHADLRDGSLRAAVTGLGIRMLVYEGGGAHRFDDQAIRYGVEGILRVMHAKGMFADAVPASGITPLEARGSTWVRARRSGFCHMSVELGQRVRQGQEVATLFETLGTDDLVVRAPVDGIVIGRLDSALINRGDALVNIARLGATG